MKAIAGFILVLFLVACGNYNTISVHTASVPVVENEPINRIDSLVNPYRAELNDEMNVVIAHAETSFTKGRPNGTLNNWAADAVYEHQVKTMNRTLPVFSLLNVGGLRNPLNEGEITVGDIYKLMPFDNEVVWVEMPIETLSEIAAYIMKSGGEPISNAMLKEGKIILNGVVEETKSYWIITSDYLMNGGDKMNFFEKKLSHHYANILLRDLFIEVAKSQGNLVVRNDERIKL